MTGPTTPEDVKQRTIRQFNRFAATYDAQAITRNAARHLLAAVPFRPGQRVLDLAFGTGHIAIPSAQRVAPGGTVTGIDIAPEMLEQCRRNAEAAGVSNLDLRVGDAEELAFADNTFDVVTCGLGVFFLPNQHAALQEWFRVLVPGGTVHFSAWGVDFDEPQRSLVRARLAAYGLRGGVGSASPLPQPEQCRQVLADAGFTEVTVTTEQAGHAFPDLDAYWREIADSGSAQALTQLTPEARLQFETEHRSEVAHLVTPEGIWRNAPVNIASGRKP